MGVYLTGIIAGVALCLSTFSIIQAASESNGWKYGLLELTIAVIFASFFGCGFWFIVISLL